jgi:CheY-like chemotaxis protein
VAGDLRKIRAAAERLGLPPARYAPVAAAPAAARTAAEGTGERARILVVDDVEANRDVLGRRLEREGYAVGFADSGAAGLEQVRAASFDLVLLDMLMPDMDGYQVLEALKADPATRDLPVIMISALDEMPSIARCIERGAEDYLAKPFDPVLLRARIRASLEKKRLRDQEKAYLRAVDNVIAAATEVEQGAYRAETLAPVARRDDALGRLARVFDGMASRVREREARLKDQVRELRGAIETARRDTKESAIVLDGDNLGSGERFAKRYEIRQQVGRGGMGTVYRARDVELEEDVAIKTLLPDLVADKVLVERFKDEIRLARRLTDRNIVRTHDFGEWGGVYYLTMEFVEGITLRDLLDTRGRLGVPAVLAIARQLAHSLQVAHEHGVVHRDIKPQNLLLDDEGVLKVMDFGIARLAERTSSRTEAGLVIGTPAYMSPEQLLGEAVDGRSDLYAAGVVLYECLTGSLPFEADSAISLIAKVLNSTPPPPAELVGEVPPALSAVVMHLLAKRPEDRVQHAAQLGEALAQIG